MSDRCQWAPTRLQRLGGAFRASRAMLTAVELGVFTELAEEPLDAEALARRLGVRMPAARDFFDALVALELLERHDGRYANTAETDLFLDRHKPSYVGAMAEMQGRRGYQMWASLTDALRSGAPQTDAKGDFAALYQDPVRVRRYLSAMTAASTMAAKALARRFPWERHQTALDVGTAQGCVPVQLALAHAHLRVGGFDLPPARPVFEEYVASFGLADRVTFHGGDFTRDPLPEADVMVMGNLLCDFDLDGKRMLVQKAFSALPEGGALIVYETMIDDDRRGDAGALLTSLGVRLQKRGAFGFTPSECRRWLADAGFGQTWTEPLDEPRTMVVGVK